MITPVFRFLLSKSRWNLNEYKLNPDIYLKQSIYDLSPESDNISVFEIKDAGENSISELEVISFLFSASTRQSPNKLFYVDLAEPEIIALGLKIRHNPATSNLDFLFYSERHYEIYPVTDNERILIAKLIFNKLENLYNGNLPFIPKNRFKDLLTIIYQDERLIGLNKENLHSWATAQT